MIAVQTALQDIFIDHIINGNSDIAAFIFLAFLALLVFRVLGVAADAVVMMVSGFLRVMTGTFIPLLLIVFLLMIALGLI
ncbi:MAG: hypothetical protein R3F54_26080 [Alphaproteobacteria bacterium]